MFASFGVREYWVVDPENQTVRILRGEGSFETIILDVGDEISSPEILPGFSLKVGSIFKQDHHID